jgi:anaerobic magnesium-protoporphyrin IX monomethyl ester cyclase
MPISSYGIRLISAYLKADGHQVDIIFLPTHYSPGIVADLQSLCADSDLIGIALMALHFPKAKYYTTKLKEKLNVPIIWGGIHPTTEPDECLEYADMVCIGEGEEVMLELARKIKSKNIDDIQNLWIKKDGKIIKNEMRALVEDLDKYPFQDYDISTHYISQNGRIVKMTKEILSKSLREGILGTENLPGFMTVTTRGCPYQCTYCCNNSLRKIYHKKGRYLRLRSIKNVVDEMEYMKNHLEFIKWMTIKDDVFFVRKTEEIRAFCEDYKKRINLPMRCLISPVDTDEEKLGLMVDAGLCWIAVGIQSYSQKTLLDVYNRRFPEHATDNSVRIINKYKAQLPNPEYHFIVDNPYETKEAMVETVRFASTLPQGADIAIYSLTLYPGTQLYDRAAADGLLKSKREEMYMKIWEQGQEYHWNYLTSLLYLCKRVKIENNPPGFSIEKLIRLLTRKEIVFLLENGIASKFVMLCIAGKQWLKQLPGRLLDVIRRPGYYVNKYFRKLFLRKKK